MDFEKKLQTPKTMQNYSNRQRVDDLQSVSFVFCLKQHGVNVFRIIPEFRILRLTFHRKSTLKLLNLADYNSFSDLFSVYLKTIDHLNLYLVYCSFLDLNF